MPDFLAINYGYHKGVRVSVAEAKNKLPELLKAIENGESVTICRHGKPVADLVRTSAGSRRKPVLGTLRNRIQINDPDWWKPMSDEEVDREISAISLSGIAIKNTLGKSSFTRRDVFTAIEDLDARRRWPKAFRHPGGYLRPRIPAVQGY